MFDGSGRVERTVVHIESTTRFCYQCTTSNICCKAVQVFVILYFRGKVFPLHE